VLKNFLNLLNIQGGKVKIRLYFRLIANFSGLTGIWTWFAFLVARQSR